MYGFLTTIPLIFTIICFIVKAVMVIRGDIVKKVNQTTRRLQYLVAGALIIGTLPFILAITNGVYFDLLPDDPYLPLVLDRYVVVGAYLGIILLALIITIGFNRNSFLLNISKSFAEKFQIPFMALVILSGCPLIVEACLFASNTIKYERYLKIVRYVAIIGPILTFSFTIWYYVSLSKELYNLSKAKKRDMRIFPKIAILLIVMIAFIFGFFIFLMLVLVVDYRSKEYILYMNLSGGFLGLSILPILDHFLITISIMVEIADKSRKPVKKVVVNARVEMNVQTTAMPATIKEKDTEIINK